MDVAANGSSCEGIPNALDEDDAGICCEVSFGFDASLWLASPGKFKPSS